MYIDTPNYSFAINPKTGVLSICYLIYKELYDTKHELPYDNAMQYISKCGLHEVPFKPVVLLIRDPIERFLSAMVHVGLSDVDECLDSLIDGKRIMLFNKLRRVCEDYHFCKQNALVFGETYVFRSPDNLREAADLIGITSDLVHLNKAKGPKPSLNNNQIKRLQEYYKEDIAFYTSINKVGQVVYS